MKRLVAAGLAGALACSSAEPADSRAGSLEVQWVGSDTGKLAAPAIAEWCDSLKLLELRAIQGDTGIALVVYPSASVPRPDSVRRTGSVGKTDSVVPGDSVTPGRYRVIAPQRADSSRPSAAVALRWFAETSIRGFRGDSGTVVFESAAPGGSAGRSSASLQSTTEGSKLTVTGSFKGVSISRGGASCAGRKPREMDRSEELDRTDVPDDLEPPVESAD